MLEYVLSFAIPITLVVLGVFLLLVRLESVSDFIWPRQITIGKTLLDGVEQASHADLIRTRWTELLAPGPLPVVQVGFLEAPPPTPDLLAAPAAPEASSQIDLQVHGVDVPQVVELVQRLGRPPRWRLGTHVLDLSRRLVGRIELSRGSRTVRSWQVERPKQPDDEVGLADVQALFDEALFAMIHDMRRAAQKGSGELARWGPYFAGMPQLSSARALAAYYQGQSHFRRYYVTGDASHLEWAVDALRTLRDLEPDRSDGLLLLGIALIELRAESEAEAIDVLDRYLELKERRQGGAGPSREALRARLLRAIARMRQYTWQVNHKAIHELEALLEALSGRSDPEDVELRALTQVQLAQGYALYLAYLRWSRVAEVLHPKQSPPIELSSAQLDRAQTAEGDKQVVREAIQAIWAKHEEHLRKATAHRKSLMTKGALDEARQRRLAFRIHLAAGVAHYRLSSWLAESGGTGGLDLGVSFTEACEQATKKLEQAVATLPGHYQALQYLGSVKKSRRCDPEGRELGIAVDLLERAIRISPSDYYGHQLLAHALLRSAVQTGLVPDAMERIDAGIESAGKALGRRPSAGAAHLLLVQLHQLKYEISKESERAELLPALERYLKRALQQRERLYGLDEEDPELIWVWLAVEARRFGRLDPTLQDAARQSAFDAARDALAGDLGRLIAQCEWIEANWVNREAVYRIERIHEAADRLLEQVVEATPDDWRQISVDIPYV